MRKGLLLLAAALLVAVPSVADAAKGKRAAKPASSFVGDAASQVLVPFRSIGHAVQPAAAKGKKAKRARKGKKSGKGKKKS